MFGGGAGHIRKVQDMTHTHYPSGHSAHDHDEGLAHDLPKLLGRRRMLALLGGGSLAAVAAPASALECIAIPWETAGPYPADGSNSRAGQIVNVLTQEGVIREDLRQSFGDYDGTAEGVALQLEITLLDAAGCTPLAGHAIYVWGCDATGNYSIYNIDDANYLRGAGISDAAGQVQFTTIFPGCYDGRWPHIHFEVFRDAEAAVSGEASVLTAQMALPETDCAAVYETDPRYSNGTRNLGRITLARDNVFADNSEDELAQQMLELTGDPASGYRGRLTVPVDFTAERSDDMGPPPGGVFGMPPPPKG